MARRSAPRSSTRRARTKLQAAPPGAPLPSLYLRGKRMKAHPTPQTIRAFPHGCLKIESQEELLRTSVPHTRHCRLDPAIHGSHHHTAIRVLFLPYSWKQVRMSVPDRFADAGGHKDRWHRNRM